MPDFASFFEQAIATHGVDVEVAQDEDPTKPDQFYISKQIGEQRLTYTTAVNTQINTNEQEVKKKLVLEAKEVARQFEQYLTETFTLGGRTIKVSPYEDAWAQCCFCNNTVDLPDLPERMFTRDAEFSSPNPSPFDRDSMLNNLSEEKRTVLKMYLIGRLRRECSHDCPNQWLNNSGKSKPYMDARFEENDLDQKIYIGGAR